MAPDANRLNLADRAVHDWYRFVLSFPPHLVRHCLDLCGVDPAGRVLDPFCGTGTTLVECCRRGISSVGIEANPLAALAAGVKTDWRADPLRLLCHAEGIAAAVARASDSGPLRTLSPEQVSLVLRGSISPLPLHKTLVLLDAIHERWDDSVGRHELLALAKGLATQIGNLRFGPEVSAGPPKADAPVAEIWLANARAMAEDLEAVRQLSVPESCVLAGDAREPAAGLEAGSIDAVVTSPPYPNEKDYTRATRLESVILGFIESKSDLRRLKRGMVRSNTRGVYAGDDDDRWAEAYPEVMAIAQEIEDRRQAMGKTSGFERLYARTTKLYFGGMARHLANLRPALRPGARLAYVVGDQASFLRVMIRTGRILGTIAESLGYEVESIDLFRTRRATATGGQLREEVLRLRWPG